MYTCTLLVPMSKYAVWKYSDPSERICLHLGEYLACNSQGKSFSVYSSSPTPQEKHLTPPSTVEQSL